MCVYPLLPPKSVHAEKFKGSVIVSLQKHEEDRKAAAARKRAKKKRQKEKKQAQKYAIKRPFSKIIQNNSC